MIGVLFITMMIVLQVIYITLSGGATDTSSLELVIILCSLGITISIGENR